MVYNVSKDQYSPGKEAYVHPRSVASLADLLMVLPIILVTDLMDEGYEFDSLFLQLSYCFHNIVTLLLSHSQVTSLST